MSTPQIVLPNTLGTLRIGQSTSAGMNHLTAKRLGKYSALTIIAPGALTGTVTVQVADSDPDDSTPNWRALHSPSGTAVTIAPGSAITITETAFLGLRVSSSGSEAADRDFVVVGTPRGRI